MLVGVIPRACDVHACRYGTGGRYLGSTCTFFPNDNTVRREDWPLFFFSLIFFYYRLHFAPVYSAGAMVKNAGFTYTCIRQFLHYVASKVIKKQVPIIITLPLLCPTLLHPNIHLLPQRQRLDTPLSTPFDDAFFAYAEIAPWQV